MRERSGMTLDPWLSGFAAIGVICCLVGAVAR
jgi:hypothetical protein